MTNMAMARNFEVKCVSFQAVKTVHNWKLCT